VDRIEAAQNVRVRQLAGPFGQALGYVQQDQARPVFLEGRPRAFDLGRAQPALAPEPPQDRAVEC
jgi:hypothetical protein